MPKYNSIQTIPAQTFFELLNSKDYFLLLPTWWERIKLKFSKFTLENVFIQIYDDYFLQSENEQALRYLELTKNIKFLEYKIAMIKSTLAFLYYSPTTKQMRIDYLEALKTGCGIEISMDADFREEVMRVLTQNIGWLTNDLNFDKIELEQMMSKSNGKQINYIQRVIDLAVASPQNLTIKSDMTLLEFVATEKAIIDYNKKQNAKNKK